jgi:hypothetical protein
MKKIISTSIFTAALLLLAVPALPQGEELFFKAAGTPANPKVQVSWNKYFTVAGVADFCKKLAAAYPNLVTHGTIGKSYQGRDINILTISDKKAGDTDLKPAFWIDGNIH